MNWLNTITETQIILSLSLITVFIIYLVNSYKNYQKLLLRVEKAENSLVKQMKEKFSLIPTILSYFNESELKEDTDIKALKEINDSLDSFKSFNQYIVANNQANQLMLNILLKIKTNEALNTNKNLYNSTLNLDEININIDLASRYVNLVRKQQTQKLKSPVTKLMANFAKSK